MKALRRAEQAGGTATEATVKLSSTGGVNKEQGGGHAGSQGGGFPGVHSSTGGGGSDGDSGGALVTGRYIDILCERVIPKVEWIL